MARSVEAATSSANVLKAAAIAGLSNDVGGGTIRMSSKRVSQFFVRLFAAMALVAFGVPALTSSAGAVPGPALTRYPYLTDSIQTSVTINWATDRSGNTGSVLWGPEGSCTSHTTNATRTGITVGSTAEYQWKATIPSPGHEVLLPGDARNGRSARH